MVIIAIQTEPKNYTIAFRYEAESMIGLPQYIEVNVDGVEVRRNHFFLQIFAYLISFQSFYCTEQFSDH